MELGAVKMEKGGCKPKKAGGLYQLNKARKQMSPNPQKETQSCSNAGTLIILSELSTMTHLSWVALQGMAHSFIALCKPLLHGKAVIHEEESHFADKEIKAQKR